MNLTRLHITGCPRSGTTLLMEVLQTCYEHNAACEHEITVFEKPPVDQGIYFSKQPNDVRWIDKVLEKDPNLYVIAILRDPREVVCSLHQNHKDQYFCSYRTWLNAYKGLQNIIGHPRVLLVRYEDLTNDCDSVQNSIESQFPWLKRKHNFSEYHHHAEVSADSASALNGVRAIKPPSSPSWMKHKERLKQQIERHPGMLNMLEALGYETDLDWLDSLKGIVSKKFKCRYPDRLTPLKDLEMKIRMNRKAKRYLAQLKN